MAKAALRSLLRFASALAPVVGAGVHCGSTSTLGPVVHQNAALDADKAAAPASSIRFRRAGADYRSAVILLRKSPRASVRSCEGAGRELGSVEGDGHVTIEGTCVDVVFAEPSAAAQVEIVTDIGRRIVVQQTCPAGGACASEGAVPAATTFGADDDRWTTWSVEIQRPAPPR